MRKWAIAAVLVPVGMGIAPAQFPSTDPSMASPSAVPSTDPSAIPSAAGAAPTTGAAPAAPSSPNLFSFFCPSASQLAACKAKLCACPPIQMFNQMLAPVGALTGGMLGPGCQGPSQDALNQPATSAEGAAARIMQEEAGAAARRAAIRYLATANCNYYPEAEAALIGSLRGDPVECVRIEAARAFVTGCCCTKKTIAALTLAVNGKTSDGFPAEHSECVKALAYLALRKCLAVYKDEQTPIPPEQAPVPKKVGPPAAASAKQVGPTPYYDRVDAGEMAPLIVEGRHATAQGLNITQGTMRQITGRNDLAAIVVDSVRTPPAGVTDAGNQIVSAPELREEVVDGPRRRRPGNLLELFRTSFEN